MTASDPCAEHLGEITVFQKNNGPLTKTIALRDGKVVNDSSACRMANGTAHRVRIASVEEFADLINGLTSRQAYTLGRLRDDLPDHVEIVRRDKLNGATSAIARTKENLIFKEGEPGFVLLDVDLKGMTDAVARRLEECGLWGALCEALPALERVAFVERASTSSGLRNRETGETFKGSGGRHIVIPVADAADIPRFLADLHDRLWLAGLGWGTVSVAGSFLERSLVDKSCGSPERLIFEGPPLIEPPLAQEARNAVAHDGFVFDTRACRPLTDDEKAELQQLKAAEECRLLLERQAARALWSVSHIKRLTTDGMPEAEARAQIDRWIDHKELSGSFPLPFDDPSIAGTTVADVLAAPDKYIDKTLSDPFEGPDYGRGKAILYRRPDGSLFIKSFAHGDVRYELMDEFEAEIERLAKLTDTQYEQEREAAANKLNLRPPRLDRLVEARRKKLGLAKRERQPKAADILIELSDKAQLFHSPDGTGYATIPVGDHVENWAIRSKGFRRWLAREFFAQTSSAPNSDALQAALNVIEARAAFDGVEQNVYVRVGSQGGRIYLDLADTQWRAIEISPDGWQIISNPPVRFRRSSGMLPLPEPVHGGSIEELRPFLNIGEDDEDTSTNVERADLHRLNAAHRPRDFVLTVSFILAAFRERGPYPILGLLGDNGAAKSTFLAVLRKLIDPNSAPLRSLPRDERDLYISAFNAYLLAFDNISKLPDWISDALCRLATGGGFGTRQLFFDQDEVLFDAMRPTALNGIEDMITRPDLVDRSIILSLKEISDDKRKPERAFWSDFERAHPRILGALLDGVAHGLHQLPETRLATLPRMADFALWVTACETAYWQPDTFAQAYAQNRRDAVHTVIEANLVATTVQAFMAEQTKWEGTSTELLAALAKAAGEDQMKLKEWPSSPRSLSGRLRRVATALRKVGIEVAFDREPDKKRGRKIMLTSPSEMGGENRPNRPNRPNSQDTSDLSAEGLMDGSSDKSPATIRSDQAWDVRPDGPSGDDILKNKDFGRLDDTDANFPTLSGRTPNSPQQRKIAMNDQPSPSPKEPPYRVEGPARLGERCHECGKAGIGTKRMILLGEVGIWHEDCAKKHLRDLGQPPHDTRPHVP
jgi:hypothetical protein